MYGFLSISREDGTRVAALLESQLEPGRVFTWRISESARQVAQQAPRHPAPPSHNQESHLNRALAKRKSGDGASRWLAVSAELPGVPDLVALTGALTRGRV